jgi:hypothetical protein
MQEISEASGAQLVTSIGRYSEVALAEVYRRHGGAVYGLARRVSKAPPRPKLASNETYQLWGVINAKTVSTGLMGSTPHQVAFTVSGSARPSELAVSVEPAGGFVSPTSPIIASGAVSFRASRCRDVDQTVTLIQSE